MDDKVTAAERKGRADRRAVSLPPPKHTCVWRVHAPTTRFGAPSAL